MTVSGRELSDKLHCTLTHHRKLVTKRCDYSLQLPVQLYNINCTKTQTR